MKIKFHIEKEVQLQSDVLEEKLNNYLKKNFYRIVEKGPGYFIFIDDEYSDRKRFRSDYHTRIGEGKFTFHATNQGANIKLIYLTPVMYPAFLMTLFVATGIYVHAIAPILMSCAFTLPIIVKVYFLKLHVFNEVLEC